jgi:predicted O-methyltransferase YrrM
MFLKKFETKWILTKNQLALVKKVKQFNNWLQMNKKYRTKIIDIDDGLAEVKIA